MQGVGQQYIREGSLWRGGAGLGDITNRKAASELHYSQIFYFFYTSLYFHAALISNAFGSGGDKDAEWAWR